MRNLAVVAVVALVTSVFVPAVAVAADLPLSDASRATIVGWGHTFQEAQHDAYQQINAVGKPYHVYGFREGTNEAHNPPCWHELQFIWTEGDVFFGN